ncbi:hypothetical protein [Streptomyces sp. YIM B13508]|uniref:hypothetical protein n=1 Tax=Streptomyces sp. YIM B13508 TaxID=3366315 RepID=UPI0036C202ED
MLSPPQFQHSKNSGAWYFCVHHETTGSPHTTHSVPHQPHTKTNSTKALPTASPCRSACPENHVNAPPTPAPERRTYPGLIGLMESAPLVDFTPEEAAVFREAYDEALTIAPATCTLAPWLTKNPTKERIVAR